MPKKIFLAALFLIPMAFTGFIALGEMQKRGFCLASLRFMNEHAKLEKVIAHINAKKFINLYKPNEAGAKLADKTAYNVIPYASVSDFLLANPDCCTLTFYDKIDVHAVVLPALPFRKNGLYGGTYTVDFKVRYIENGKHQQGMAILTGMIDTCGEEFSPTY